MRPAEESRFAGPKDTLGNDKITTQKRISRQQSQTILENKLIICQGGRKYAGSSMCGNK
jgi:hypothetical protein